MMNSDNQKEMELDRLLLLLSRPLTRFILSTLAGIDPGHFQNKVLD